MKQGVKLVEFRHEQIGLRKGEKKKRKNGELRDGEEGVDNTTLFY